MNYRGHDIDTLHAPAGWIVYVNRMFVGVASDEVSAFRFGQRVVDMTHPDTRPADRQGAEVIPIGLAKMMQGIGTGDWEG